MNPLRRLLLAALALAGGLGGGLPASSAEAPPAPGEPQDFVLPDYRSFTLDNGLRVTLIPFGATPKVTVAAVIDTGSIDEGRDTWLADLVAEMMSEGTTSRSAATIALEAADMGGALSVSAGEDQSSVGIDVLSEKVTNAIALVADVLQHPVWPASELDRVKANLARRLSVAAADPQTQASAAYAALIYGDHPYGRTLPSEQQINAYTLAQVRDFHAAQFGARRTHVYVAGRFDASAAETALREAFGDWVAGLPATVSPPKVRDGLRVRLIDRPGAPQSTVYLGLRVVAPGDPRYLSLSLMNTLLGGSFNSRIVTNLREDKGYAYSPQSYLSPDRGVNTWTESVDVTTEHTAAAIAEIFKEIARLQNEVPTAEELDGIKNYRAGTFIINNSSRGGLVQQLQFLNLHGLPPEWLTSWVRNIHAIPPAAVTDIARSQLTTDRMTLVVVGDLKRVRKDVLALPALRRAQVQ
jgi:predicted Zn-dependent peptidase